MSEIDFERVNALLNIIKQCADIGGMNNIVSEAQAELVEINAAAYEAVQERNQVKAEGAAPVEEAEDNPPPKPGEEEEEPEPKPAPPKPTTFTPTPNGRRT